MITLAELPANNSDEIVNYIFKTYEYEKFSMSPYNRAVAEARKERIILHMKERNLLLDNAIAVDLNHVIISGQGRYLAAIALGLPLYYYFSLEMTMDDVRDVSDLPNNWSMKDQMNYWVAHNHPDYILLKDFWDTYPWLALTSATALIGKGRMGGPAFKTNFNRGGFHAGNLTRGYQTAKVLVDFKDWIPTIYRSHAFISVIRVIAKSPNYDHSRMMQKMKNFHSLLTKQAKAEGYYTVLTEIYNKYAKEADRVHFDKPTRKKSEEE